MKTMTLVFSLLISVPVLSFFDLPANESRVKADIRCEGQDGGIAFSIPKNTEQAKVWSVKRGEDTGYELKVNKFQVYRCPGCFKFEVEFLGTQFFADIMNMDLIYKGLDSRGNEKEVLRARCLMTEKKAH
ncbi:MAG: hypothetical protein BroJett040_03340 [Oligoflexia bacterium]|nr:MAG: hypothetical protein BroJett040_03340 [Oligoflexia bacterium]